MASSPVLNVSPSAPRRLPRLDDTNRPYWTAGAVGELQIAHCDNCRRFIHPPEDGCPQCGGTLRFVTVSGDGVVFTYTIAHQQFHPDVPTPFVIALVELAEQPGLRLATNIVGCEPESVSCGMPVRVRFERHDIDPDETDPDRPGTVFVPVFTPVRPLT